MVISFHKFQILVLKDPSNGTYLPYSHSFISSIYKLTAILDIRLKAVKSILYSFWVEVKTWARASSSLGGGMEVVAVLELSAKYQRRCGRLRYFVAGVLRLLCLSHYTCEVHYLPALSGLDAEHVEVDHGIHNPTLDPGPLASSIDSSPVLAAPTRLNSNSDFAGVVNASYEPSDYVRGLDGKTKRPLPRIITPDEETVTVSSASPSPRARTRSKSKAKSVGSTAPGAWREVTGSCLGDTVSTTAGTRWGPLEGMSDVNAGGAETDIAKSRVHFLVEDEKWENRGGPFLGVIMCNHQCKTVQCIQSQALAPPAEHDDGNVHLLLVHNVGRLQLLRFFLLMQFGRHISLPFVECIKVCHHLSLHRVL